jgi:hypothetical protein
VSGAPQPSRRTALLGLLAELRGAGVTFTSSEAFFQGGSPHILKVVVDREPGLGEPFARAAAAIGVPALFLLPHGRVRPGVERRAVHGAEDLRRLAELGHELGLEVDLDRLDGELPAALRAAVAPFADAGVQLTAAGLHHDERHPFDAGPLAAVEPALAAIAREAGLRRWLDATCLDGSARVQPAYGVAEAGGRLRAESLDPPFPIHTSPPGVIDALTVAALVDTVARGSCVHELRLSSLV